MRAVDLDFQALFSMSEEGGVLRFGGRRVLLLDAVALGLLRRGLIETLGLTGAKAMLTRFGYAHGWHTAESLQHAFPWESESEWRRAGGRLHTLQGLVSVERGPRDGKTHFADAIWHDSYEAEQHLFHFGQADHAVCWTLSGFASGYLSFCNQREIYCLEERCRGKGDAFCRLVGRYREDWGEEITRELPFYRQECLHKTLAHITDELKHIEQQLQSRKRLLGTQKKTKQIGGIIAQSEPMQRVLDIALRVAKVDATILITGESGVGKERVARCIHGESSRTRGPFLAINCGALPENLLESELFGHSRGAFTGASQDRPGLFEAANQGTLFLDEVGELSLPMQVKLLRVLQEREVRRIGENNSRKIDVRILAATNRELEAEVAAGRFRQDLYYRLRVVALRVPPLRERPDDILPLAHHFLADAAQRYQRKPLSLSPRAANRLLRHAWLGNVRELENTMERAAILAQSTTIDEQDLLDEPMVPQHATAHTSQTLAAVEKAHILATLTLCDGDKAQAASQLDIGLATLYRKLKQYETHEDTQKG